MILSDEKLKRTEKTTRNKSFKHRAYKVLDEEELFWMNRAHNAKQSESSVKRCTKIEDLKTYNRFNLYSKFSNLSN